MNTPARPDLAKARVTADVVLFTIEQSVVKVLLIERAVEPFQGQMALPGGFLWANESTSWAARRVLEDKAGVSDTYLEQLYTFDNPGRDPRGQVVSVAYMALVEHSRLVIQETADTQHPGLYDVAELPGKLAFDHHEVVMYALTRLRSKLQYSTAVKALLAPEFTFIELQQAYEAVLGTQLDRRNFRKKYMSLGLIQPTGARREGGRHRPAELYRFDPAAPVELERWF